MRNNKDQSEEKNIPNYLAELLQPTPSGVDKLLAAWDGLSIESQIILLDKLAEVGIPNVVRLKAMESPNAYVRYLGARGFCIIDEIDKKDEEMKSLKKRIEEDPAPLVRYSTLEENSVVPFFLTKNYGGPDSFFSLPHEARLAKVRCLSGWGEKIANLISYALDHQLKEGTVSETELFEILNDYLNKPEFAAYYKRDRLSYDGYGEYLKGKDIESLWNLVLKVPEWISHFLIENLPKDAGFKTGIPEKVLTELNDRQLTELLDRKDIELKELRKQIFFKSYEKEDFNEDSKFEHGFLRSSAIVYNFDLTYKEFSEILAKPVKKKVQELIELTNAQDLSLCLYEAIHDSLFNIDSDEVPPTSWEYAEFAKRSFVRKLLELQGYKRDEEIRELRLYRLAKQSVPWKKEDKVYPPSDELGFLAENVVKGDTWATFMEFSANWRQGSSEMEKYLPRLYEIDDLLSNETDSNETSAKTSDNWNEIILEHFEMLQSSYNRLKLFLYVIVALLILLLIYGR
jgi:hypothetical protein